MNLGYSLTWIIGYLASRPDLQKNGHDAIREVYNGEPPKPHEYDRVEYVKALHTVSISVMTYSGRSQFTDTLGLQEGSRIYTPVRLGFPRQTLDGASYNGQKIPKGMVRTILVILPTMLL